jgi:hypothetical protein
MRMRASEGAGGGSTSRLRATVVLLVLAGASMLGCGGDDGETTAGADSSSTGPRTDAPDLHGPGTAIAEGLVVPVGAALGGATFRWRGRHDRSGGPASDEDESWAAVLLVEDDPFAVFDDLAAQVRELGPEMPGTGDACAWLNRSDDERDLREPVAWGEPSFEDPWLMCEASASDRTVAVSLEVTWADELPGALLIEGGASTGVGSFGAANWDEAADDEEEPPEPVQGSPSGVDCEALASTEPCEPTGPTTQSTMQPPDTLPELTADPVPDDARELLDEVPPMAEVATGDAFGGVGNCFSEGYRQFDLPPDATVVASQGGGDGASVLAVDDLGAVVAALVEQSDASEEDVVEDTSAPLLDGTEVEQTRVTISAGGGGCTFTGSPDGRHLLITMHSD